MINFFWGLLVYVGVTVCYGQDMGYDPRTVTPATQRQKCKNFVGQGPLGPGGSCVQASIAMMGIDADNDRAATLLRNSKYGPPVLGGSWPDRVTEYAKARGIDCYNIEGNSLGWIRWALRNGRDVAISWGVAHMITAVDMKGSTVYVCDNNRPQQIQAVPWNQFIAKHSAMQQWCVILKGPKPSPWVGPTWKPRQAKSAVLVMGMR